MAHLHTAVFHPDYRGLPDAAPPEPPGPAWGPDLLGAGFQARALALGSTGRVATLVRHVPAADPQAIPGTPDRPGWCALYVHGWNDYFFQRELARHISAGGGAFYAVDLHHYGRSLRDGDVPGWCTALSDFAVDLSRSLRLIGEEHPGCPVVLIGHSTGGLLAALWALHRPGSIAGLWLTSPWLELQGGARARRLYHPLLRILSTLRQGLELPVGSDLLYATSMRGWNSADGPIPARYVDAGFATDPSFSGFDLVPTWKNAEGNPVLAGWLYAITSGHTELARARPLDLPLLLHASTESFDPSEGLWDAALLSSDAVLDTDALVGAGATLTTDVTIRRYAARHDPLLSFPDIRQAVWADLHAWSARILPGRARGPVEMGEAATYAICP